MAARMRAFPWERTPLGSPATWPQSLVTVVRVLLTSRFAMWMGYGPELTFFYNDAYAAMTLGTKHPWALGRRSEDVWREIWPQIGPRIDHVLRTGEATWDEALLLFLERSGFSEETYHTFSYSPVSDDDGRVAGNLCVVTEETARVVGARRLSLLRDIAAAVAPATLESTLLTGLERVLGRAAADLPFTLMYVPRDEGFRRVLVTGVPDTCEWAPAMIASDAAACAWPIGHVWRSQQSDIVQIAAGVGSGPWTISPRHAIVAPIAQSTETPAGVLVAGLNACRPLDDDYRTFVSLVVGQIAGGLASVHAYEAERARAESLAALDRAKTTFFTNISHEFRTPLTLMLGPTEDALASPARALTGAGLDTVHRNALRLLKLVNALLEFSRLQAGQVQGQFAPVDLAQLTQDYAACFASAFQRAGVALDIQVSSLSSSVFVDASMWERVVLNLLSNALKFTLAGCVTVRLVEESTSVVLEVTDTGCGIPPAELPHVFTRFHRIEGAKGRTHEGSGIGLALVHDLVTLHGGSCTLSSTVDVGTCVRVVLPFGHAHLPADAVVAEPRRESGRISPLILEAEQWVDSEAGDAGSRGEDEEGLALAAQSPAWLPGHILVADDNADMRRYLERLLKPYWVVTTVADGQAALAAITERRPDVVLTDVMMPTVDGFGVLRSIRERSEWSDLPVILLTARAGESERVGGVTAGADDYLVKPFAARELVARVHAQMRLAHAARERRALLERERAARKNAELQKAHLHALFMQAPMPIAVLRGPTHVVELANPSACRVWGRPPEDVIGRPLLDALPELRGQAWAETLDAVYTTGRPEVGNEVPARLQRHASGALETLYFNFAFTPLVDADDAIDGLLCVGFDVTDQVVARRDMAQLRTRAESANRAKDEFLAMLGHELRNPLAPISTALQLIKLRGVTAVERERHIIERQVQHLVALVDDLLDVSRITRGKIELKRSAVELSDIVAKAVEMASPLLEQQAHNLELEVPRQGLTIHGDPARLAQVAANLLTNAAKYTEPGGHIKVSGTIVGSEVQLTVKDSGIGIDAKTLPVIFEAFAQEPQALDRARGGLGLGLAIVRSLVELHGGSVSAFSEGIGRGSEFVVRLPRAEASAKFTSVSTNPPLAPEDPDKGIRVLVVDDNHDAVTLLAELLAVLGYTPLAAHDGPTALRIAAEQRPHIALIDLGLPVMDGYELAERLSGNTRFEAPHLLAVTGYGQERDRQRSRAAGFAAHLVKPVSVDALREALDLVRFDANSRHSGGE